jgi:hypothetical protein
MSMFSNMKEQIKKRKNAKTKKELWPPKPLQTWY